MSKYRIAVDIGGTFTDCTAMDETGKTFIAKGQTTPEDPVKGFLQALELAAENMGISLEALLENTVSLVHGTTLGTNALITRKGSKVGLITTKGFEDTILIGNMKLKMAGLPERDMAHYSKLKNPVPIVPHDLIYGVAERVDRDGEILMDLNKEESAQAIDSLIANGVKAIAISLLWSFLNPSHENEIRKQILAKYPDIYVTVSHEVSPTIGEYERTVTAVFNSYIGPIMDNYLENLERALRKRGYIYPIMLVKADGGLTTIDEIRVKPVFSLDSGPTGGVIGAQWLGKLYGEENVMSADVGGTTFDVGLVIKGQPMYEKDPVLMQYNYRMPKVMVKSVGAGGGSIARVEQGLLRVGPESAGSNPGPACYDRGGELPTVTDAVVVLGYLNPDFFWGGRLKLNKEKSSIAVGKIANALKISLVQAASAIYRVINSEMAELIRRCSLERGYDPRKFILFSFGGGGALHACNCAVDIGAKRVIIPNNASVFSAGAMLQSAVKHVFDVSQPVRPPFTTEDVNMINEQYKQLTAKVYTQFDAEGTERSKVVVKYFAFARYESQINEIMFEMPKHALIIENVDSIVEDFSRQYEDIYGAGTSTTEAGIEFITFRVEGTYTPISFEPVKQPLRTTDPLKAFKGQRPAYFEEAKDFVLCNVYEGEALEPGMIIEGPCLVERLNDTVVVPPPFRGSVDEYTNIQIVKKGS